jgi:glycosyltransferase involved in cell wall biosynthesis
MPDVRVLLVGGGPQENLLRQTVEKRNISDKVIFTGRVPHQQVQRYYDLIDILVYPRLSMRLTELVTPLKPLEAMAQGRLLIASDVGGHRELICNGSTGVMFQTGNSMDLADKVLGMFAQPESWAILKMTAREFVEQNCTWELSVARYKQVYSKLLGRAL